MTTRAKAFAAAAKFGFVFDEENSGKIGDTFTAIFDHPTHSIAGDCRSITECSYGGGSKTASQYVWEEIVERLESEGPWLQPCTDSGCDYHNSCDEG
jgi:hypothetical protein